MDKKEKKHRKNISLIEKYIYDVYHNNIDVYTIIDIVQRYTPDSDPYLGVANYSDIFARILRKMRDYFGGDSNLESRYCWHTRCGRDFLRRRRLLRKRIKEGRLK